MIVKNRPWISLLVLAVISVQNGNCAPVFTGTEVTHDSITISWNGDVGVTNTTINVTVNDVEYTAGSSWDFTANGNETITGRDPATSYTVVITADVNELYNQTIFTAPYAPTHLVAATTSTTEILLTWNSTASSFRYDYKDLTTVGDFGDKVNVQAGNSVTVSSLAAGHQYEFRVYAVENEVESAAGASATEATKPNAPSNIQVSATTTETITLTWDRWAQDSVTESYKYSYIDKSDGDAASAVMDVLSGMSVDVSVSAGHQYTFSMYTVRYSVVSDASTGVNATAKPKPPTDLSAAATTDSITFSWSAGTDSVQDKYIYQYKDVTVSEQFGLEIEPTDTSVILNGRSPGHQYEFRVWAVSGSEPSMKVTVTHATIPPQVTLTLIVAGTGSLSVTWINPDNDVAWTFKRQHKLTSVNTYSDVDSSNAMDMSYQLTGLDAGVQYDIRVIATSYGIDGAPAILQAHTRPLRPSITSFSATGTAAMRVEWEADDASTQDSFNVEYRTDGNYNVASCTSPTSSSCDFAVSGDPGVGVTVRVTAVVGTDVASEPSTETGNTKPASPITMTIASQSDTELHVSANKGLGNASAFEVSISSTLSTVPQKYTTESTFLVSLSGLTPGTLYTITMWAVSGSERSEDLVQDFYTNPPTPAAPTRTGATTDSLSVAWSTPDEGEFSVYVLSVNGMTNTRVEITHNDDEDRSHTFEGLTAGTQYTVTLKTELKVDPNVISSTESSAAFYIKPNPAQNIAAALVSTSSLNITWAAPTSGDYTSYIVALEGITGSEETKQKDTAQSKFFDNLFAGTQYTVQVMTQAGDQQGVMATEPFYTRPNAPQEIVVTDQTDQSASVSWAAPESGGHDGYQVTINEVTKDIGQEVTTYHATGLRASAQFVFTIISNAGDRSSDQMTITVITEPKPVTALFTSDKDTTDVRVSWTVPDHQSGDSFSGYEYQLFDTAVTDPVQSNTNAGSEMSKVDFSSLTPGNTYKFEIKPFKNDDENNKLYGTMASFEFTMVPSLPSSLQQKTIGTTFLEVQWQRPTGGVESYELRYKKRSEQTYQSQPVVIGNDLTVYQIDNLEAGLQYDIGIRTKSKSEYSDYTSIVLATEPTTVTQVQLLSTSTTSISISWTEPDNTTLTKYQLTITPNDGGISQNVTIQQNENLQYTFNNLSPGISYVVGIVVYSNSVPSKSKDRTITTNPSAVQNFQASTLGTSSISLTWSSDQNSMQQLFRISYSIGTGTETSVDVFYNSNNYDYDKTLSSLTPGAKYTCKIYARTASDTNGEESEITQTTKPDAVINIVARTILTNSLTLEWTKTSQSVQDKFVIEYQGTNTVTSWTHLMDTAATDTSLDVTGLQPGDMFSFQIHAVSNDQTSDFRNMTEVVTYPLPPSDVSLTSRTVQSLTVRWMYSKLYSIVEQYRIEYTKKNTDDWSSAATVNKGADGENLETTIAGLTSGANYTIRIFAITFQAKTSTTATSLEATVEPVITTILTEDVEATTTDRVSLTYSEESQGGVFDHYLFSIDASGNEEIEKTKNDLDRNVLFMGLTAGTRYTVNAKVFSGTIPSSSQKTISITTRPNRPSASCSVTESGRIVLALTRPSNSGITSFHVVCNGCHGDPIDVPQNENTAEFTELAAYTDYTFKVTAVVTSTENGITTTKSSSEYTVVCSTGQKEPGPVENLIVTALAPYKAHVSWEEPSETNGVLKSYAIDVQGRKSGNKDHVRTTVTVNASTTEITFYDLRAGYTYAFSVRAKTVRYGDIVASTVTMRIEAPYISLDALPMKKNYTHSTVTMELPDPFSDKNGELLYYTVIVSRSAERPGPDLYTYADAGSQSAGNVPYAAVFQCVELFSPGGRGDACWESARTNRRRRQATSPATTTLTLGGDTTCVAAAAAGRYCNGPLQPESTYYVTLRGYTEGGLYTDGRTSNAIVTEVAPPPITTTMLAIILAVVAAIIIITAVIVIVVILRRKGMICNAGGQGSGRAGGGMRRPADNSIPELDTLRGSVKDRRIVGGETSRPVKVKDFSAHYLRMAADSDLRFSEEYEDLKSVGREQPWNHADLPVNRNKNRFTNILPYDHSRVKLLPTDDEDGSDYINANWMPGYNSKREFCVTQGPLPSTCDDFWRMAWEQNARAIVMLTKCVEKGREKCHHYWPTDAEPMYYGDLRVIILNETKCTNWVVSEFEVAKGDHVRRMVHFHYTGWPDFGVPEKPQSLIHFVRMVRSRLGTEGGPIIVHCSAGVGRSGTYITLDRLLQIVEAASTNEIPVDVFAIVCEKRKYRVYMVQTEQQYVCIHTCLKCVIEGRENEDNDMFDGQENGGYETDDEGIAVN